MTLTDWRQKGYADAENARPYNPPEHGPTMQAYTAGFDEAARLHPTIRPASSVAGLASFRKGTA